MATPQIKPYAGDYPNRNQAQSIFSINVGNFLPYFDVIGPEYNAMATWTNDQVATISQSVIDSQESADDSAASATASSGFADNSAASANMVGNWIDQTGSATKPLSVVHAGSTWLLLNDLADITLSEPGATADWFNADSTKRITHNRFLHFYRNR